MKTYITVFILRDDLGDCTLDGVTSEKFDNHMAVEVDGGNLTEEEVRKNGYVILELGTTLYCNEIFYHFNPENPDNKWYMCGGNFVTTSDSRFSKKYGHYPIPVHDRCEQ